MNRDDFEKRLERQPMRAVPPEWRAQILREATAAVPDRRNTAGKERQPGTAATAWWRELLWPRPLAWASLAAAWVVIAILHSATPAAPTLAAQPTASSSAVLQHFAEQRRELAGLLDTATGPEAPHTTNPSGPRSQLAVPPVNA